jgi:hypothetical protein
MVTYMVMPFLKRFWPLLALLLLFAASVGLRWGSFAIDPVKDHKWTQYQRFDNLEVFEHVHYVGQVYDANPVNIHKFAGYIGKSDEFLTNKHLGTDGYTLSVYTSFPPTHFIFLYETLRLFGSNISFFGMQIVSLALHVMCIGMVFWLAMTLTKRNRYVSFLVTTPYIFSTATLWQHMNVFWAHQLLMPIFLGSLILFIRRKGLLKKGEALALGFAMAAIAWTGFIAVVGFVLYAAHAYFKTKNKAYLAYLYMLGGAVGALVLIVLQALWTTGASFTDYLNYLTTRVSARSGGVQKLPLTQMVWYFVNNLLIEFGTYAFIAYSLALVRKIKGFEWAIIFVSSFPIIESFLLLEHDQVYGFARLKWFVPIIVITAICGSKYATTTRRKVLLGIAVALANLLGILGYFTVYW